MSSRKPETIPRERIVQKVQKGSYAGQTGQSYQAAKAHGGVGPAKSFDAINPTAVGQPCLKPLHELCLTLAVRFRIEGWCRDVGEKDPPLSVQAP